jgi:hypothetical protein
MTAQHRYEPLDLVEEASRRYAERADLAGDINVIVAQEVGIGMSRDYPIETITAAWGVAIGVSRPALAVLGWARTYSRGNPASETAIALSNVLSAADVIVSLVPGEPRDRARYEAVVRLMLYQSAELHAAVDHLETHGRLNPDHFPLRHVPRLQRETDAVPMALDLLRSALRLLSA